MLIAEAVNKKRTSEKKMNTQSIISKVWSFCTTLRDDGVGYGDYLTQITYLIFLKMADEYSKHHTTVMLVYQKNTTGRVLSQNRGSARSSVCICST